MSHEIDPRSQGNIDTLRTKARPWFVEFIGRAKVKAAETGLEVRIISGNRTWAEQDALYAQGRSKPGPIVTRARGGQSNHNYGIAVDIGVFQKLDSGKFSYLDEHPLYDKLGPIGEALGLEWGGHWSSITDKPHYQIRIRRTVGQLKALVDSGGWSAIDALIPTFGAPPVTPQPPATPPASTVVADPIAVFFDSDGDSATASTKLSLDAWFVSGRTWVALSDWCDYFGGEVVARTPTSAILRLNEISVSVSLQTIDSHVTAPFGEVNGLLGWDYSFDGVNRPRRLTIHQKSPGA